MLLVNCHKALNYIYQGDGDLMDQRETEKDQVSLQNIADSLVTYGLTEENPEWGIEKFKEILKPD